MDIVVPLKFSFFGYLFEHNLSKLQMYKYLKPFQFDLYNFFKNFLYQNCINRAKIPSNNSFTSLLTLIIIPQILKILKSPLRIFNTLKLSLANTSRSAQYTLQISLQPKLPLLFDHPPEFFNLPSSQKPLKFSISSNSTRSNISQPDILIIVTQTFSLNKFEIVQKSPLITLPSNRPFPMSTSCRLKG